MFEIFSLDVNSATTTRTLNWVSDCIVVQNLTPYPLYINWTTTSLPTQIAYDVLIPGGMEKVVACKGNNFGFRLDTQGVTNPAVGQRCNVTIQVDEIVPSFSQANWRSSFSEAFDIPVGQSVIQEINCAGAYGINLNVFLDAASGQQLLISFATSDDNQNYSVIEVVKILGNMTHVAIYAVGVNYARVTLQPAFSGNNAVGKFTYSLLPFYSPTPEFYYYERSVIGGTVLNGNSILLNRNWSQIIPHVLLEFNLPLATDTFDIDLLFNCDGVVQPIRVGSIANNSYGSALPYLTRRRLNQYAFRIPVNIQSNRVFSAQLTNNSGVALSNVDFGVESRVKI